MSTPTPRTDAEYARYPVLDTQSGRNAVLIEFPRNLETELSAALARNVELEGIIGKFMRHPDNREIVDFMQRVESLTHQLSEAQAQLSSIQEEADHYREQFVKANRKRKAVSAQLTSAREDSARLDWLSENPIQHICWSEDLHWLQFNGENFTDLRSAIDSARGVSVKTHSELTGKRYSSVEELMASETPAGGETEKDAWQDISTAPKDGTKFVGLYGTLAFTTWWQAQLTGLIEEWRSTAEMLRLLGHPAHDAKAAGLLQCAFDLEELIAARNQTTK